jgi:hypothetical protein
MATKISHRREMTRGPIGDVAPGLGSGGMRKVTAGKNCSEMARCNFRQRFAFASTPTLPVLHTDAIVHSAAFFEELEMIVRSFSLIATCLLFSASSASADGTLQFLLAAGIENPDCPLRVDSGVIPFKTRTIERDFETHGNPGYVYISAGITQVRGTVSVFKVPAKVVTNALGQTVSVDLTACGGGSVVIQDKLKGLISGKRIRLKTSLQGFWSTASGGAPAGASIETTLTDSTNVGAEYYSRQVQLASPVFTPGGSPLDQGSEEHIDFFTVVDVNMQHQIIFHINGVVQSNSQAVFAVARFSNTGHAYVDSLSPDQDLSWESGLSHSDPDFKRQAPVLADTSGHPPLATSNPSGSIQSSDFKILGGGAASSDFLVYSGPISISKNIATVSDQSWSAGASSDVGRASTIDVRAIQFPDPSNLYALHVEHADGKASEPVTRGVAVAALPSGFVMTGGGCRISAPSANPTTRVSRPYAAFLTGSYRDESNQNRWICEAELNPEAKQPVVGDDSYWKSNLTAYVIGIKPLAATTPHPFLRISKRTAPIATNPVVTADLFANGFLITGGGGRVIRSRQSIDPLYLIGMLPIMPAGVGTYPATQWQASAKGGARSDLSNSTLTSFAMNVLFQPPKFASINPQQAASGATVTITGENFVTNMKVRFGSTDVAATVSSVNDATVIVPSGLAAGDTPVQLLAGDIPSAPYQFTVLP